MSNGNSIVEISSDGNVTTFDAHGTRIKELSGDLPILHRIVEINRLTSRDKSKLPHHMRLMNSTFFIMRDDTKEGIMIPIQHILKLLQYIKEDDVKEFMNKLLLQVPQN